MMKMIRATEDATYRTYPTDNNGVRLVEIVSLVTHRHEDDEIRRLRSHVGRLWVKLATNRIAFRHDERRGPISATLTGAVY